MDDCPAQPRGVQKRFEIDSEDAYRYTDGRDKDTLHMPVATQKGVLGRDFHNTSICGKEWTTRDAGVLYI
jgi:hypothetical protein